MKETYGNVVVDYRYDNAGNPYKIIVKEGSNTYTGYYVLNQQGDVIAIIDELGNLMLSYKYNAWGVQVGYSAVANTNGAKFYQYNALKYRGYYYDAETGFYYLQTRYYDPILGRFISADGYISTGQDFIGYNMYAYCANNPVMRVDLSGMGYTLIPNIPASTYEKPTLIAPIPPLKMEESVTLLPPVAPQANTESCNSTIDLTEKLTTYMEENAAAFREYWMTHNELETIQYFYNSVKDGGAMDIKLQDDWKFQDGVTYTFNDMVLREDDPGNINFGYVGAVVYSCDLLCFGAGLNQIKKYGFEYGNIFTWYDDPRDQEMIRYGYNLYVNGGL